MYEREGERLGAGRDTRKVAINWAEDAYSSRFAVNRSTFVTLANYQHLQLPSEPEAPLKKKAL